jgi:hypothetical protein
MSTQFLFKSVLLFLLLLSTGAHAQDSLQVTKHPPAKKPVSKKLITKLEVFAGPGLAFNRGNMFVENYQDANVTNKRLLKPAYVAGVGVFAPLTKRIDLNVRMQFEQKGTRSLLELPYIPNFEGSREFIYSDISYQYLTALIAPRLYLDERKRLAISVGLYAGRIIGLETCSKITNTVFETVNEGCTEGRFFLELDKDGYPRSLITSPGLSSSTKTDYGMAFSLAYILPITQRHTISLQLFDNLGLRNIEKHKPFGYIEKNHTLNLSIGYLYNL